MHARGLLVLFVLLVTGCDGAPDRGSSLPPGNTGRDAGPIGGDAGVPRDGAVSSDGGLPSDGSVVADGALPNDAGSPADGGSPSFDAGPGDAGSIDAGTSLALCYHSCNTPSDCVAPNAVAYTDADNYACTGGVCRYLGCNNDNECASVVAGWRCVGFFGYSVCQRGCATVADCVIPNTQLHGADNYECNQGACFWKGCNSTSECTTDLSNSNYVCEQTATVANCNPICGTAADCVPANGGLAYDLDNYACVGARCQYLGCHSQNECTSTFSDPNYLCTP